MMFPFWYCFVCQSCEDNSFLSTSLHNLSIASSVLFGHPTTCITFAILPFWSFGIPHLTQGCGWYRFSPVDLKSLYSMNRSSTPQKCVKSHHIDKPTCWLLLWRQHRPSGSLVFRCSVAVPTISLFTLSYWCYQQQLKTHFWWSG